MRSDFPAGRRILVLSMHYEPEPNFITTDVARALTALGPVTVVTAHPNYPFGRFYPGTDTRPRMTLEHGVKVWRLPFFTDHSTSAVRRGLSYFSFALAAAVVAPFVGGRPAVVWVYHTPFTTALAALWFRFVLRVPLVYTSADLWPESLAATEVMRPGRLMRTLYAYSRWINRQASLIICSTRGTARRYHEDGIDEARLAYIPVWVGGIPEGLAGNQPAAASGEKRIVYAGNIGPAQRLETVVRAAAALRDRRPDLVFELYGAGASEDSLRALATELDARNVRFMGRVAPEEAFRISAAAHAQIVALRKTELFRMTIPSKLAFALAAGSPMLYALEGEPASIAAEGGNGIAFDSDDAESLVRAIESLDAVDATARSRMRAAARAYYQSHFARATLLREYLDRFRAFLAPVREGAPARADRSALQ